MAKNHLNVCLTLPGPLLKKLDEKAQRDERPRSFVVRKILERSFAGESERSSGADSNKPESAAEIERLCGVQQGDLRDRTVAQAER